MGMKPRTLAMVGGVDSISFVYSLHLEEVKTMDKNVKARSLETNTIIETTLDGPMKIQELYELYMTDFGGGHSEILYGLFTTLEELERCRLSNPKVFFVGGHKTARYLVIETAQAKVAFKLANATIVNGTIDVEFARMTTGISVEQLKYLEKHFKDAK